MSMYLVNDLSKVDYEPIREGFSRGLVEAGRRSDKVVALCADLTGSIKMDAFAKEFPERFVEVGIAEQNLVTVASGMAAMGYIPFAASYAAFSPGRNWEQIRTTIALNDRGVKIVGGHAGLMTGPDGATHQALEDIALMRVMPNMVVVIPADSIEAEKAVLAIAEDVRPAYLRLARDPSPRITSPRTPFSLNRAYVLSPGKDISLLSTGTMTFYALEAAERLYKDGIDAEVIHVPVVKPLDAVTILQSLQKTKVGITIEEAQIIGGFGSAVAELASDNYPVTIKRIGVRDRFGESGTPAQLFDHFKLNAQHITHTVHSVLTEIGRQ